MTELVKILLDEDEVPRNYYNIAADLEIPAPLHPGTREPLGPAAFEPLSQRSWPARNSAGNGLSQSHRMCARRF